MSVIHTPTDDFVTTRFKISVHLYTHAIGRFIRVNI